MELFELQQNFYNVGQALKANKEALANAASDPSEDAIKTIEALNKQGQALQLRYDTLKKEYEDAKAEQTLKNKNKFKNESKELDPKERLIKAEAAWIRKTVRPDNAEFAEKWNEIKEELKDDNTTNGGKLLPIHVSNQLIAEPFATNPLRDMENMSTVTNLIMPRIAYEISDDGFVNDGDASKDATLTGGQVVFGRHQYKVRAGISDTILLGSDVGLVEYVNNALNSGMQEKEIKLATDTSATGELAHMSFYDTTTVNIKKISGTDMFDTIADAVADLDDPFQDKVQVLMSRKDYNKMIRTLANGSRDLYGKQPEEIIGYPVKFSARAVKPIVGVFSYGQWNYDVNGGLYEQYKDYQHGMNYFQYTAWVDHQILLPSAFRIVDVTASK
ncbi:phage major capsid protein [Lactobacillus jensenii]|jgi:HK97 family phage major capsid protein|uniref:Phage major capsid protein n=1 Tax=Lactobacillus jensenii TaxID=109790 RepID=A0ABU9FI69_LACJE|nr:phage major capsid protein [Lactobacillus jensenii]DAR66662.1 MAG TPA: major capsid protein [Caudoviricetes sp.]MCW8089652.1 phage major capsid protein [Lactobacillus jensenii]MDK8235009.1 phage major capsid protein [Lactobacillus jensenii]MDT9545649.1 phage major capsid protein [Lactobacillus jensenii]MDT9585755.1 phage major capsid protein [Lactobacillus jensenii]